MWHIGPRNIPLPHGASDELRDSIAATPLPDLSPEAALPADETALKAFVAEADAATIQMMHALRDSVGASVTADAIGGVPVFHVTPAEVDPRHEDHLFVHVHGGAFVLNGGEAGVTEAILLAHNLGIRVVSIDYRMAPNHPLPTPADDVMAAYRQIIDDRPAASVALGGTSGGGNLCTVTVQRAVRDSVNVPGALYLGTPGNDMSEVGDSLYINRGIDRIIPSHESYVNAVRLHADGRQLTDPFVSPIYGGFEGFPPTFLVTGTRDLLLSSTVRTHTKIRSAGSVADLIVLEGVAHGDYMNPPNTPESRFTFGQLNAFLLQHLA